MKDILIKYKKDFYFIGILSIVFLVLFLLNFKSFVIYLFDMGREFYVPSLILQGKVLYKEVFMMYPPMGYQFNAVLYAIFGQSFKVLMTTGLFNAYVVLTTVYLIARQFVKPLFGFSIALVVLNFCLFCFNNIISYIYPYSYNLIYATSTFLLFCLFSIIYIKSDMTNNKYSYSASLFLGISFANRLEYALCIIPFLLFLIIKKRNFKFILLNIFLFLIPSFLCWGFLFIQGLTFTDLVSFYNFGKNLWNTPSQKLFITASTFSCFTNTVKQLLYSVFCIFCIKKFLETTPAKKIVFLAIFLIFSTYISILFKNEFYITPFCLWNIFLILICAYLFIKNCNEKYIYLLATVYSLLISIRFSFLYNSGHYIYFALIPIIFNLIFVYNLKIKDSTKNALCLFLIVISFQMAFNKIFYQNFKTEKIQTSKGSIYMRPQVAVVYDKLSDWIIKNTDENDKILMLPEAPLINFITDRLTDNRYFQLLPNHIDAIGENKIINDLNKDKPKYILLQNLSYEIFGHTFFGYDFGLELKNFIVDNYSYISGLHEDYFSVLILERK